MPNPVRKSRLTFSYLVAYARAKGVIVERTGRKIEFWRAGKEHTVGMTDKVSEAYNDIVCDLI